MPLASWRHLFCSYCEQHQLPLELIEALEKLVAVTAFHLPAALFAPQRRWDKESKRTLASDLLQTVILRPRLPDDFCSHGDEEIEAYLRRGLRWQLYKTARSRGAICLLLFQKVREALRRDEDFCFFEDSGGWGLRAWQGRTRQLLPTADRQQRLSQIEVPCRLAERSSGTQLPTDVAIGTFLRQFLTAFDCPATLQELIRALQVHFDVYDPSECQWPVGKNPETGQEELVDVADPSSQQNHLRVEAQHEIRKFIRAIVQNRHGVAHGVSRREKRM